MEDLQDYEANIHQLAQGESLSLGEVRLEVIAVTTEGSALMVHWQNFRALIPGGVDIDQIPPEHLTGLSVLVLEQRDFEKTEKVEWESIAPTATIVTVDGDALPMTGTNWLSIRPQEWIAVETNGKTMSLSTKEK